MKKSTIGAVVILLSALAAIAADPQVRKKEKEREKEATRSKIEGTWQKSIEGENLNQVKIIGQGYFLWVTYDRETRMSMFSAGGSYTLQGDTYKERIQFGRFATPELQSTVGKEQVFKVVVDGDTLTQTGTMTDGDEIREVWRRVR